MCGQRGDVPATEVVSANFTDWDAWRWRTSTDVAMLCGRCAGRYRDPDMRRHPCRITDLSVSVLTRSELTEMLAEPLDTTVAVTVPVH